MNDIECPYCNHDFEVCNDDGHGCYESVIEEEECPKCGKRFVFHTAIQFVYTAQTADCLNGSPHRFSEWGKLWIEGATLKELQERRCLDCQETEQRRIDPPS